MLVRDEIVLPKVRKAEQRILRSLPLISVIIASLYLLGYIWRIAYYSRIGVPLDFLDFPFPETLLPKSWCLIIFVVSFLSPLISYKFYDYFIETRRVVIAKAFGVTYPLERVIEFLGGKCSRSGYSSNAEALMKTISEYIKERSTATEQDSKNYVEGLRKRIKDEFADQPKDMQDSIISLVFNLMVLDRDDLRNVSNLVAESAGERPPRGYKVPNKIIWPLFLFLVAIGVIFG
jgi:hypothetical protein